jgi:hypothetical protein
MRTRSRFLPLVVAIASALAGAPLAAQVVTGVVVQRDSVTAVASVIVAAVDAQGASVVRTLTSQRGEFVLRLPSSERYSLRVLRIGYRPTQGPAVSVAAGETERVRIVVSSEAVTLAAMGVKEQQTCRVNADTGLLVARVWEEARKAMLTSQLSTGDAPLFAEWVNYDRVLDPLGKVVQQQSIHTARNPTTHAFRSVPIEVLQAKGYVVLDSGATHFYAPDADVLLSDAFVTGHCFRLADAPRDRPGLIGVAFQPSREREELHEIEGTLWLDRATAELRTLEFRYLNLPDVAQPAHPGGTVEFLRLGDGNWLVSRWSVRMPMIAAREKTADAGLRRTIMTNTPTYLRALQVTGGEVMRATRHDSLVYQSRGPSVAVQVVSRDTLLGAAGARLTLEGTDYAASADASGRIRLAPVLAGRYRAAVRTAFMDSLGMPPVHGEVEARQDAHVDSLMLPTPGEALAIACPRDSIRDGQGMLHGRVRDESANVITQAAVTVTWKDNVSLVETGDGTRLSYGQKTIGALTDDAGNWRLCGVPQLTLLSVAVVADSGSDVQPALLNDRPYAAVDLVVHRASAATREISLAVGGGVVRPHALVELSVADPRGEPLPGTALELQLPGRSARTLVTGASGKALVPDVAPGVMRVRARHVGYLPGLLSVTVAEGRNTVPIVLSTVAMPTLDTMRVVGGRTTRGRLAEFEERRVNHQATVSFTREEIQARNPTAIWQMLTNVPSMKVADRDNQVVAVSPRFVVTSLLDNRSPCFFQVVIDGVMMNQNANASQMGFDLRDLPPPDQIQGMEVFSGPAAIPVQYGGEGKGKWCGLIAVWTR